MREPIQRTDHRTANERALLAMMTMGRSYTAADVALATRLTASQVRLALNMLQAEGLVEQLRTKNVFTYRRTSS